MKDILMIDDDRGVLECTQKLLTHLGYRVKMACSGQEGLSLLSKGFEFDLVMTDIDMPGMSGNEVARCIRNSYKPGTPIVAVTGFVDNVNRELFDFILEKPFKLGALAEAITSLVL